MIRYTNLKKGPITIINRITFTTMNRKKAICTFAIIETLVFLLIDLLFMMEKLSVTGLVITLAVAILLSMGVLFTIIRKTQ